MASCLERKKPAVDPVKPAADPVRDYFQEIIAENETAKKIQADSAFSPGTSGKLLEVIKKRKQDLSQKILDLSEEKQAEEKED